MANPTSRLFSWLRCWPGPRLFIPLLLCACGGTEDGLQHPDLLPDAAGDLAGLPDAGSPDGRVAPEDAAPTADLQPDSSPTDVPESSDGAADGGATIEDAGSPDADQPVHPLCDPTRATSFFDQPFPDDRLQLPDRGLDLQGYPTGRGVGQALIASYVRRAGQVAFGFGLHQPVYFRFSGRLNLTQLQGQDERWADRDAPRPGDPLFLVALNGPWAGQRVPLEVRFVTDPSGDPFLATNLLILAPRREFPLASGTRYLAGVTRALRDATGRPLEHAPSCAQPFTDLLPAEQQLALGALAADQVVAATIFTTQHVVGQAERIRQAVDQAVNEDPERWFQVRGWREVTRFTYTQIELPAAPAGGDPVPVTLQTIEYSDGTRDQVHLSPLPQQPEFTIETTPAAGYPYRVFEGELRTTNLRGLAGQPYATPGLLGLLADLEREDGAIRFVRRAGVLQLDAVPEAEPMRILLQLPAQPDGTLRRARGIWLWDHGTAGSAYNAIQPVHRLQDAERFARTIARHDLAILSRDQPLFGKRYDLPAEGYEDYLAAYNPANPPALRDQNRQGGIDGYLLWRWANERLNRHLEAVGLVEPGAELVARRFLRHGHSLGSVTAHYSLLLHRGHAPAYDGALMSGSGGLFSLFFLESGMVRKLSPATQDQVRSLLATLGTPLAEGEPLTPPSLLGALIGIPYPTRTTLDLTHPALALLQLLVDPGDPLAYARELEAPERLIMGVDDWQVPNSATHALTRALGQASISRCEPRGDYDPHYCTYVEPEGVEILEQFLERRSAARTTLPRRPAVWSEYLSPPQVQAALPRLAELELDLNLAAARGRWSLAELTETIRQADETGVRVRLWPLLTLEEGYWANEGNVAAFRGWLHELMDLIETERLPVDTFELDLEPAWERVLRLQAAGGAQDLAGVLEVLQEGRAPAAFAAARERYRELIAELHQRGYWVELSTLPMVLDDLADGDDTIQDLLDVPVTGLPWDRVSFQLYRTALIHDYGALLPAELPVTAHIVHSYAVTAVAHFGARAAADLGLIRSLGAGFAGATEAEYLWDDIAAARGAGISADHLQLFALDGLVEMDDWAAWAGGLDQTLPATPAPAESTTLLRELFRTLDGL